MPSYYVMNRRGIIKPTQATKNQCKAPHHPEFHYHLIMVFDGGMTLDHRKFILDHQEVDDLLQATALNGSCEEMHLKLSKVLRSMMGAKSIPMLASRCVLRPTVPDGAAWLEYIHAEAQYLPLLSLT